MFKTAFFVVAVLVYHFAFTQTISTKLADGIQQLEADTQMKHAAFSLLVKDAETGAIIFSKNIQMGLAPASCQKIITSAAAFELLGQKYQYKTTIGYSGTIKAGKLEGKLWLKASGDPSFGSWRYQQTKDVLMLQSLASAIKKMGIKNYTGELYLIDETFSKQAIPDGWIWQDIGNYYGAGAYAFNWKENQYNLVLQSNGIKGSTVHVVDAAPKHKEDIGAFFNELIAADKGSGDNAFIYLPLGNTNGLIKGSIPINEKSFSISGADEAPMSSFVEYVKDTLVKYGITISNTRNANIGEAKNITPITSFLSPKLDSINYWFMKKSINLYGEALVKTISLEKTGFGSTEKGVETVQQFWQAKGIDPTAMNITDGSGLSPQNRVTTDALVKVLQFAEKQTWFNAFYDALPEYNGMKLKSGTINGVKAFCGYHTSKLGKRYIIAFIINNFNGAPATMVQKMYTVLNVLK